MLFLCSIVIEVRFYFMNKHYSIMEIFIGLIKLKIADVLHFKSAGHLNHLIITESD